MMLGVEFFNDKIFEDCLCYTKQPHFLFSTAIPGRYPRTSGTPTEFVYPRMKNKWYIDKKWVIHNNSEQCEKYVSYVKEKKKQR